MDPETAAGNSPQNCAANIVKGLLGGDREQIPFFYLLVIWIRVTWPWLYFRIMEIRAIKQASRYRNTQSI